MQINLTQLKDKRPEDSREWSAEEMFKSIWNCFKNYRSLKASCFNKEKVGWKWDKPVFTVRAEKISCSRADRTLVWNIQKIKSRVGIRIEQLQDGDQSEAHASRVQHRLARRRPTAAPRHSTTPTPHPWHDVSTRARAQSVCEERCVIERKSSASSSLRTKAGSATRHVTEWLRRHDVTEFTARAPLSAPGIHGRRNDFDSRLDSKSSAPPDRPAAATRTSRGVRSATYRRQRTSTRPGRSADGVAGSTRSRTLSELERTSSGRSQLATATAEPAPTRRDVPGRTAAVSQPRIARSQGKSSALHVATGSTEQLPQSRSNRQVYAPEPPLKKRP